VGVTVPQKPADEIWLIRPNGTREQLYPVLNITKGS